jgi:DNA-binding PadR family transcriptional regulator
MNSSFPTGRSESGAGSHGIGGDLGFGIFEALDGLREAFVPRGGGSRMGRGDVRTAILALLLEEPMHGYQLINEIEKRSGGAWKPSPGSVYPTLQLLADEGLVQSEESADRKTYALTEAGRAVAEASGADSLPWESSSFRRSEQTMLLPKAGAKLAQAVVQVSRGGTPEQQRKAVEVVDEARRKLYAILAED